MKIIIHVKGGVVQGVYSDKVDPHPKILIYDEDDEKEKNGGEFIDKTEKHIAKQYYGIPFEPITPRFDPLHE